MENSIKIKKEFKKRKPKNKTFIYRLEDDELLKDLYFNNFLFERSFENKNLFNSTFNILNKLNKMEVNENIDNQKEDENTQKEEENTQEKNEIEDYIDNAPTEIINDKKLEEIQKEKERKEEKMKEKKNQREEEKLKKYKKEKDKKK